MPKPALRAVDNQRPHDLDIARARIKAFILDRDKGEKPLPVTNIVDSGSPLLRADDVLRHDDHDKRIGRK